mgnify:CR=1 FL=1
MELGRIDANLRSETELIPIIEPGGGIDQQELELAAVNRSSKAGQQGKL